MKIAALFILICTSAFAKKVHLKWESVSKAKGYEIELHNGRGPAQTYKLGENENRFEKDLPFGIYQYRIRVYDWVNRPGDWSQPESIAVLPKPPLLTAPSDGEKKLGVVQTQKTQFKWEHIPGLNEYEIQISKDSSSVETHKVNANSYETELTPGTFEWKVRGVVRTSSKDFFTDYSDARTYKIVQENLKSPKIQFPIGRIEPLPPSEMNLKWEKVPHAEKYEYALVNEQGKVLQQGITDKNEVPSKFRLATPYKVKVRSIAQIDGEKPSVTSEYSEENFKMEKQASFPDPDGEITLGVESVPDSYMISYTSPWVVSNGVGMNGYAVVGRASIWPFGNSGFDFFTRVQNLMVAGNQKLLPELELNHTSRVRVGDRDNAFLFLVYFGAKAKDYLNVTTVNYPNYDIRDLIQAGMNFGLEVRKYFSKNFVVSVFGKFFMPMFLFNSGSSNFRLADSIFFPNMVAGANIRYWMGSHLGVELTFQSEQEAAQYYTTFETIPRHLTKKGFFVGIHAIYSFGR